MPHFALLTHDHPFPHWDFLLEVGEVCRTWRLMTEPGPGRTVTAEPLPDHRRFYLTHEGFVGGNRGSVARWDAGEYELLSADAGGVAVRMSGTRISGHCTISRDAHGQWQAVFAPAVTELPVSTEPPE